MANIECASFVLKATDLPGGKDASAPGGTNGAGSSNTYMSQLTWTNIDLRSILGDMYYKYDKFNLCLTTLGCDAVSASIALNGYANNSYDNLYASVNISGLPWINQTYNQATNHNRGLVPIALYQFPATVNQANLTNYNNPRFVTFGKSQDTCNITIQFNRIIDDNLCVCGGVVYTFPLTTFLFSIYGIPKDPGNENGSRIIM